MQKYLPSGASLEGLPLPYGEAWAVSQAVLKELKSLDLDPSKIDLDLFKKLDLKAEIGPKHLELFLSVKDIFCSLLGSQKMVEAVDKCFTKFTYNSTRINGQTFEIREARQDYLFAAFYVLYENVTPFFVGLSSSLKTS